MPNVGGVDIATLGLRLDGSQVVREGKRAETSLQRVSRAGTSARNVMVQLGATMSAGLLIRKAVRDAGEFSSALQQSIAIMGDVSDVMRGEMVDAARTVGRELNLGATQAAESFFFLASAGFNAEQSIAALPAVATFAKAGMFDMALATDLATDAQSALGLKSNDVALNLENLTRVTDVLVKANTLANATVQQFSAALTNDAGAAAKAFNVTLEESVAVLAAYADQGIKSEEAGSAFGRLLRLLIPSANENADQFRRLGIEVFNTEGNLNSLADIIRDLEVAFADMSVSQKSAELEALGFQKRVQQVILPLLGTSEAIRTYERSLHDAGGVTQEVAEKQMLAPIERLGRAMQTFKEVSIDAGNAILEVFVPAMEVAAANAEALTAAAKALALAVGVSAGVGLVAAFGRVALSVLASNAALLSMIPAIVSVGDALAFLQLALGPAGWLVLGISALTAGTFLWTRAQKEAREEAERLGESVRQANRYISEQTSLIREETDAQLEATQAQLMLNIARLKDRASIVALDAEDINSLHAFVELLRVTNDEIERRRAAEAAGGGGSDDSSLFSSNATRAIELEIQRTKELNEAIGETQHEIDLINLAYDERIQKLQNAEEYEGEELRRINELTSELFAARRATLDLDAAEEQRKRNSDTQESINDLQREVRVAREFYEAQRQGKDAINQFRIALAGENAVLAAGSEITSAQAAQVRALAEEKERLRIKTEELTEAQRDETDAAQEAVKQISGIYEEAARGIQRALADGFYNIQEDGLRSFQDLADNILDIFQKLAAEIAALMVAQELGLDKLIKKIREGQALSRTESLIGSAGAGLGLGLGTGDPLLGGLAGAGAGFAIGGPVGAAAGAFAGLIGGIIGAGKAAEEARRRFDDFQKSITDFRRELELADANEFERGQERIRQQLADFVSEFNSIWEGLRIDIDFAPGAGVDEWIAQLQDAQDKLIRIAELSPFDIFGSQIEGLQEIMDAARLAAEQLTKEFEELIRVTQQNFTNSINLLEAELTKGADSLEYFALQQEIETQRRIDEAQKLLDAGLITQAMFEKWVALLRLDASRALDEFNEKLAETADKAREASASLTESFVERGLRAAGNNDLADYFSLVLRQQKELQALADEDPAVIELVKMVQELERQTLLDEQKLRTAQEALAVAEDSLSSQRDTVSALEDVIDTLTKFTSGLGLTNLSPLSPIAQLDLARQQFNDLLRLAQAGDQSAAGQLPAAARALLEASEEVNARGTAYIEDFNMVQSTLSSLTAQFQGQLSVEEKMLAELEAQRAEQAKIIEAIQDADKSAQDAATSSLVELATNTGLLTEQLVALLNLNPFTLDIDSTDRIRKGFEDATDWGDRIGDTNYGYWGTGTDGRREWNWYSGYGPGSGATDFSPNIEAINSASASQIAAVAYASSQNITALSSIRSEVSSQTARLERKLDELSAIMSTRIP